MKKQVGFVRTKKKGCQKLSLTIYSTRTKITKLGWKYKGRINENLEVWERR